MKTKLHYLFSLLALFAGVHQVSAQAIAKIPSANPTSESQKIGQIWFAPFMYGQPSPPSQNGFGALDYLDLFKADSPWSKASSRVKVLKLYTQTFKALSDEQLNLLVNDLTRRGIAIGLEAPLIWGHDKSYEDVAAHASASTLQIARRVQAAGGTLRYVAMDEPFCHGSYQKPPKGGGLPVQDVARGVSDYVQTVKREFPDVIIGDIEPSNAEVEGVERFLEAYRDIAGQNLPFLHLDVQWENHGSERTKQLENYAHAHGITFGIIYDGLPDAFTDAMWLNQAEHNVANYETLFDGHPDQIIFQSWQEHPHYLLPETDPSKFTWLINHYFCQRTKLIAGFSASSPDQPREAVGKLTTLTGAPVVGARIELSVKPIDGPAQFAEYAIRGIVPTLAKQAIVGFRVNQENQSKTCDFTLYGVSYREETEAVERISNNDFSQGLKNWKLWPGAGRLQISDRGSGQALKVTTTVAQKAGMNSAPFAVTGKAAYTVTFRARVVPSSIGSGYFAIFFPGDSEIFRGQRQTIPLEAQTQTYSIVTDRDGSFHLKLNGLTPGHLTIQGKYAGDDDHWSCCSSIEQ